MAVGELASKPIHELRGLIDKKTVAPKDILNDLIARIEQLNPSLNAYLRFEPDRLRAQLSSQKSSSSNGVLSGIPITIKDNICINGEQATCASKILQEFRSPYDATVIERLRDAGAMFIPGANMDEFAFGSSTENSSSGPVKNPRAKAKDRVPGGSSGGSAAAVAADMAIAALGSDTGGSIRQPAAFCGVVGLKPTYGRVSRYGLIAFASSLDQIGPLTKDVKDAALLLSVIAGHDERDSTSVKVDVQDYINEIEQPIKDVTIGLPDVSNMEGLEVSVRTQLQETVQSLTKMGMKTIPIKLPNLNKAVATYYIVATAEASSNLSRYDGSHYGTRGTNGSSTPNLTNMILQSRTQGFGPESKRRILLGTYVLSQGYYDDYYLKGMKVRTLIKQDFDQAFESCDAILMPTTPTTAFKFGEKVKDPLQMYLSDVFTISANLAGVPAISICAGKDSDGLPIGMQLIAKPFDEPLLFRIAHQLEQQTQWPKLRHSMARGD